MFSVVKKGIQPIPVVEGSKTWVYGRSLVGIAVSNLVGGHESLFRVIVVCCQVEFLRSFVQRGTAVYAVSECD
jgi:hypothetical protein